MRLHGERGMLMDCCVRSAATGLLVLSVPFGARAQTYSQTETITYHDNAVRWVIGQVAQRSVNGQVVSSTTFDPAYAMPLTHSAFGKLQQTLTYDTTSGAAIGQRGTVRTVKDGNNNVTALTNWRRGVPQSIAYADGTSESAAVNADGTIASVTDENGYKTCYEYDAMRRVNKITYPSETQLGICDTSKWAATTISFNNGTAAAYGMPAGHWRQTTLTGNGRHVIVYDALWRPVIEQALDLGNVSGTISEVIKRYDSSGRLAFESYPMRTNGTAVYTDPNLRGSHYSYDALDRVTEVRQNWENDATLGLLSTRTAYLAGFKTEVTNPRGYKTVTAYMAYDQPRTDWPVAITHPEGAYTDIVRDVFGRPRSLKRRNATASVALTRNYVYDGSKLCKTVEPETGATVMHYDAAGNLDWSAAGLATLTSTSSCQDTDASIAARKVTHSYDARNRIKTLSFPDGRGNTTYNYHPDGSTASLVADNGDGKVVTSTYTYNKRRLLAREILQSGPVNWPIDYTYNANGHLASQVWHGLTVDYAPNALGQPTKAGSFASGVSYYPNGAIEQFTYGNGIVHTLTQNVRGLPDTSRDAYGTTEYLDDGYDYDANGNVKAISDGVSGARGNRTMTYDGLDRLKTTVSPMYGASPSSTASYSYDALDNLIHMVGPGRDHYYCYDTNWRLTNVKTGSCSGSSVIGLGYDSQGNLQNKNGVEYAFDFGNRLRSIGPSSSPIATYAYDGHGRRVWDYTTGDMYSHYTLDGRLVMTGDGRRGKVSEYIQLGGTLLAIRERDVPTNVYTTKYQHTDALGSPVRVTDATRMVLEYNEYEPFGKVLVPSAPKDGPGYTGHVFDSATGLNYMQQRYYDPQIGRFLSVDPVSADTVTGWNFNRYNYAANNPYKFTDPDGRSISCDGTNCRISCVPAVCMPELIGYVFIRAASDLRDLSNLVQQQGQEPTEEDQSGGEGRDKEPVAGAADLVDDLAGQELIGEIEAGEGKVLPGMGDKKFDPESGTHDKVAKSRTNADGTKTELHAERNRETGKVDDAKIKQDYDTARGSLK